MLDTPKKLARAKYIRRRTKYRHPEDFEALLKILLDYELRTATGSAALPRHARALRARIPALGSIIVIAPPPPAKR